MEHTQTDLLSNLDLQVDQPVQEKLYESTKWARFIAIVMFIAAGLLLIAGLLGGSALLTALQRMGREYDMLMGAAGPLMIVVVVLAVALIVTVYYFLFNYADKIKKALVTEDRRQLAGGIKSLKVFFIITTVLSALSLLNSIINFFK
jgi:hypothetical protein